MHLKIDGISQIGRIFLFRDTYIVLLKTNKVLDLMKYIVHRISQIYMTMELLGRLGASRGNSKIIF